MPKSFKQEVEQKWNKHLQWLEKNYLVKQDDKDAIAGVLRYMNASDKSHLLPSTIEKLKFIDGIRNENWQDVFPELESYINE